MSGGAAPGTGDAAWHPSIDAIGFRPHGHDGLCFVHRLAFRTLIGADPDPADCLAWFGAHSAAFAAAAAAKIRARRLPPEANLHLTSRDIGRESGPRPA
ncbi:MAG: hypothetical protein ABW026_02425 [Microvirga sp.]